MMDYLDGRTNENFDEQYEQNIQQKEDLYKNQLNLTLIDEEAPKYPDWEGKAKASLIEPKASESKSTAAQVTESGKTESILDKMDELK